MKNQIFTKPKVCKYPRGGTFISIIMENKSVTKKALTTSKIYTIEKLKDQVQNLWNFGFRQKYLLI